MPTLAHKLEEIRGTKVEKNKAGEAMESTFVLVQTAAFSRLLVLMGLPYAQQFKITSFSAAQLHDELDVSGTTCPYCGRSACS